MLCKKNNVYVPLRVPFGAYLWKAGLSKSVAKHLAAINAKAG